MSFNRFVSSVVLLSTLTYASSLDSLLEEYHISADQSNKTVNEKVGHVTVIKEQELKRMQYDTLGDVLKTLHGFTLNYNIYGTKNLREAGNSGALSVGNRVYINDHELSSVHTLSPFLTWDDLPLDFISHIEIYHGDSSFSIGSEPGTTFIRVYTKSAKKENGGVLKASYSSEDKKDMSLTHSKVLPNNWSYLAFASYSSKDETKKYKTQTLDNSYKRRYAYLDINNEKTYINFGYADLTKKNFKGLSLDVLDEGEINSKDMFLTYKKFLDREKTAKVLFAIDINDRKYYEQNAQGIGLFPVIDFTNRLTIPKYYNEDLTFTKYTALISKEYKVSNNKLMTSFNIKQKDYDLNSRTTIDMTNSSTINTPFSDHDKETLYSLVLEDNYKVNDKFYAIANLKFDRYERDTKYLNSVTEKMYRIGGIYTPTNNLGFKSYYSSSYVPASFYQVDMINKSKGKLSSDKYKSLSLETMYHNKKDEISFIVCRTKSENLTVLSSTGFEKSDENINSNKASITYSHKYNINSKLKMNAYYINSDKPDTNSNAGADIKYFGKYKNIEYFSSLVYKRAYETAGFKIDDGYDLSLGASYNLNKNTVVSLKGENILNKQMKSLMYDNTTTPSSAFSVTNEQREFTASIKWMF